MEICVTPWQANEIEEISRCEEACFAKPYSLKDIRELYESAHTRGFIARADGAFVGYASLMSVCEDGDILRVAVYPAWRRKGFARALMTALVAYAKEKDLEQIFLDVRVSNEAAIALYEGFAFEKIGVRKKYYENGEDAYMMRCRIQK